MEKKKIKKIFFIIFFSIFLFLLILITLFYLRNKELLKEKIGERFAKELSKQINRKVEIKRIETSFLEGLILKDICIKENDGKTNFFCFKEGKINLEKIPFLKGKIIFSDIILENGQIYLKEDTNGWNFYSILKLKNDKPLQINYNTKNLKLTNFYIFIKLKNGNEFIFDNANLNINHRSNLAGNFFLNIKSNLNSYINKQFISCIFASNTNFTFNYLKLKSIESDLKINNIVFDDITIKELTSKIKIFNLTEKPKDRKFDFNLKITNSFIPKDNDISKKTKKNIKKIEKIIGKNFNYEKEININNFNLTSTYENKTIKNYFFLKSNLIDLDFKNEIDFNNSTDNFNLNFNTSIKNLEIKSNSKINEPKINSNFSETLKKEIKDIIIIYENFIKNKLLGD